MSAPTVTETGQMFWSVRQVMNAKCEFGKVEQYTDMAAPSFPCFWIVFEQPLFDTSAPDSGLRAAVHGETIVFKHLEHAQNYARNTMRENPDSRLYIAQTIKQFHSGSRPLVVSDAMPPEQTGAT